MKFEITKKIKNKIFNLKDIKRLASSLEKLKISEKDKCIFTIYFDDSSQQSDESVKVFDDGILDYKVIKGITLEYYNFFQGSQINIRLFQKLLMDGEYTIISNNEDWYLAQIQKYENFIKQINDQSWISKIVNSKMFPLFYSLFLSIAYSKILDMIKLDNKTYFVLLIIGFPVIVLIGLFLIWYFPSIMIDLGKKNTKSLVYIKWIKAGIALFFSFIIVPIIQPYVFKWFLDFIKIFIIE